MFFWCLVFSIVFLLFFNCYMVCAMTCDSRSQFVSKADFLIQLPAQTYKWNSSSLSLQFPAPSNTSHIHSVVINCYLWRSCSHSVPCPILFFSMNTQCCLFSFNCSLLIILLGCFFSTATAQRHGLHISLFVQPEATLQDPS